MESDRAYTINHVYCVSASKNGETQGFSLAIRPTIEPAIFRIYWEDTEGHGGRIVDFRKPSDLSFRVQDYLNSNPPKYPGTFSVVDQTNNLTYTLEPLTLDVYNQKIKKIAGQTFESDKELQDFYLEKFFNE